MSQLPYLCNFRIIIHIYSDSDRMSYELLHKEVWTDGFAFRSKEQKKKEDNEFNNFFNAMQDSTIKIAESELSLSFLNDNAMVKIDYGNEILDCSDIIKSIIDYDLSGFKDEHYFEIIGKLHSKSWKTFEGDWDSEEEVSDLKFQELDEEDIIKICKI